MWFEVGKVTWFNDSFFFCPRNRRKILNSYRQFFYKYYILTSTKKSWVALSRYARVTCHGSITSSSYVYLTQNVNSTLQNWYCIWRNWIRKPRWHTFLHKKYLKINWMFLKHLSRLSIPWKCRRRNCYPKCSFGCPKDESIPTVTDCRVLLCAICWNFGALSEFGSPFWSTVWPDNSCRTYMPEICPFSDPSGLADTQVFAASLLDLRFKPCQDVWPTCPIDIFNFFSSVTLQLFDRRLSILRIASR